VDAARGLRLTAARRGHPEPMRLKRTLAALVIAGTTVLTGCAGTNTDVTRGETNCDGGEQNSHDQNCTKTSTPTPADNT
jgi:predicted small secreted protein